MFPAQSGINLTGLENNKTVSKVYLVRYGATSDTPASKSAKITAKGLLKAPKVKVDYKKEIIKLKEGMSVFFGEEIPSGALKITGTPANYSEMDGRYIVIDEETAKAGLDISKYITNIRNTILVWSAATKKKAATDKQTIELAKRQDIEDAVLNPSNGKLKLDKKYEVWDESKEKWGSLPSVSESCELKIRLKATAKGGKESDSTFAASRTATLKITYGTVNAAKGKDGITAAAIVGGTATGSGSGSGSSTSSGSGSSTSSGSGSSTSSGSGASTGS